jgi:hypothetical protein
MMLFAAYGLDIRDFHDNITQEDLERSGYGQDYDYWEDVRQSETKAAARIYNPQPKEYHMADAQQENTYLVNELNTKDDPFEVVAAKVEHSEQSGRIIFTDLAGEIVASFINATFRKLLK